MDKQVVFYVSIFLIASFALFWLVIILSILKQRPLIQKAKKSFADQKNIIQVRLVKKLEEPQTFYRKQYTHQIIGIDIDTKEEVVLYVTFNDAFDCLENEEYEVIHDGIVIFEMKKRYF